MISIRGFVVNYFKNEDERLFSADDAFIIIHKIFVEKNHEFSAKDFVKFLNVINNVKNLDTILTRLERGTLDPSQNPFINSETSTAFSAVFGQPNNVTYHVANLQKHVYHIFTKILGTLLDRWSSENSGTKKKGIRFDKDPEWQPDDRVVLFEEFYQGKELFM